MVLLTYLLTSPGVASEESEGIKLNNEAVELLNNALSLQNKKIKKNISEGKTQGQSLGGSLLNTQSQLNDRSKPGFFDKILGLFFGKKVEEKAKDEANENTSSEEGKKIELAEVIGGEFLPGKSKEEKEQKTIDNELVYEAYKKTIKATVISGQLPEVRMNLGLALELSGDLDNAYKAYNMAEQSSNQRPAMAFVANYNKARVLAEQKKTAEALSMYQKALNINPESKEVKVNIELLMQQQQGGGGGGDDKKDDKNNEGKEPKPDAPIKKNPKNSEYKSKNLSKKNVEKILEELKNQEQKIREKEYNKGVKEKPRDKDW